MGRKMRLELTTSGTTNQRSNQLSYIRHLVDGLNFRRFFTKSQAKNKSARVRPHFTIQFTGFQTGLFFPIFNIF